MQLTGPWMGLRLQWIMDKAGIGMDYGSLGHVERPSRYMGGEVNSIVKAFDSVAVRFALVFPDVYEVGMSHVGLRILYHVLNSLDWVAAERVFSPWVDMEGWLTRANRPLLSLESKRPLMAFDVVGFSLQHELVITNVLSILRLSGLEPISANRREKAPLVVAGGPACFNPEPFAGIFDAVVIGDGEEVVVRICELVRGWKASKGSKEELLKALSRVQGVYVPRYFQVRYKKASMPAEIEPLLPGYDKVRKAIVPDINAIEFPTAQIVPFTQLIHDRLVIEISRGCARGCRFCQAGMIYRPLRERSKGSALLCALRGLRETGYEEVSLLSLSSGDYSCIQGLVGELMDLNEANRIGLSLPSLRVDTVSPGLLDQIKRVRKTGFTLAPETGSQELRFRINKQLRDEEIFDIARKVYEAGWQVLKLYFMAGLPFEDEKAILETRAFLRDILRCVPRRGKLHVNISCFVPKAHTPFMWEPQIGEDELKKRIRLMMDGQDRGRLTFKGNPWPQSWLEGIFSRGDRSLLPVAMRAFEKGARFDAWAGMLNVGLWMEAFKEEGIDPSYYHRARSLEELLPWEHIDSGVKKGFMLEELKRAGELRSTSPCFVRCEGCGVCDHKEIRVLLAKEMDDPLVVKRPEAENLGPPNVIRLKITKIKDARYMGHLEYMRSVHRAMRRAGLSLGHSKGFHPMPKLRFMQAIPLGLESLCELLDVEVMDPITPRELKKRLNQVLPHGVRVTRAEPITSTKAFPSPKTIGMGIIPFHDMGALDQLCIEKTLPDLIRENPINRGRAFIVRVENDAKTIKGLLKALLMLDTGIHARVIKMKMY